MAGRLRSAAPDRRAAREKLTAALRAGHVIAVRRNLDWIPYVTASESPRCSLLSAELTSAGRSHNRLRGHNERMRSNFSYMDSSRK